MTSADAMSDPLPDLTAAPGRFRPIDVAVAVLLAAVVFAVYLPTRHFDFTYYDDQVYVAHNPYVQQGLTWAGVRYACTATLVHNWHPLTILVELTLSSLFGPSPATFHVANAALHAVAVGLLFAFLRRATGRLWPAAAVAALWGLHPLRVESVAWVAELKDELTAVTTAAALLAYAAYARRRTAGRYAVVAACVVLALLSKPVAVTLPFLLLLTDYWPLGRRPATARWWVDRVAEKVPLFALSAATAAVAVRSQVSTAALVRIPVGPRLANAVGSVAVYVRQVVWPTDLGLFYPHPWIVGRATPAGQVVAGAVLLVGVTAAVLLAGRRRPYLPVGWLWFLVTLVPVIGLLQAGEQARADRFTLLPAIGLTTAAVWLVADWAARRSDRAAVAGVAAAVVAAALTLATVHLVPTWRDANTLWARGDAVIPDNYIARSSRSVMATDTGDPATGERLAREALAMVPLRASAGHVALAVALAAEHQPKEAVKEFADAIRLDQGNSLLRYRAGLFLSLERADEPARQQLERAIHLDPTLVMAREALGTIHARNGRYAEAIDQFRQALALDPGEGLFAGDLADALRLNHQAAEAVPYYAAAVAAGDRNPDWEAELAWLVGADATAGPAQLQAVVGPAKDAADQTAGREPFPPYAYSLVLARLDRYDDAVAAGEQALAAARATGQKDMAAAIATKLTYYRQGLPAAPATQPTTAPAAGVMGPTTTPAANAPGR